MEDWRKLFSSYSYQVCTHNGLTVAQVKTLCWFKQKNCWAPPPPPPPRLGLLEQKSPGRDSIVLTEVHIRFSLQQATEDKLALLRVTDLQFSEMDVMSFTPNRPLVDFAIVGAPGTKGYLEIFISSQLVGFKLLLQIHFLLAPCPWGFAPGTLFNNPKVKTPGFIKTQ